MVCKIDNEVYRRKERRDADCKTYIQLKKHMFQNLFWEDEVGHIHGNVTVHINNYLLYVRASCKIGGM